MHHWYGHIGPHGHGGNSPHGPHGGENSSHGHGFHGPHWHRGHSPHGPHGIGHSPHGNFIPHGHGGHSPHGPHGHYGGHGPHEYYINEFGYIQYNNNINIQMDKNFPQFQNKNQNEQIPQTNPLINQNIEYKFKQSEPQNYLLKQQEGNQNFGDRNEQKQKVNEYIHDHPLNFLNSINGQCKICTQEIGGNPGYSCGNCKLLICLDCGQKIFYEDKNSSIHAHPLLLRDRNSWKCDLCKKNYKNIASFYCKQCDFDACYACYIPN